MINYTLEIIPGTKELVTKELLQRFPKSEITKVTAKLINFSHEQTDVDTFRTLYSALRISKENGPTRNLFRREWRKQHVPAGINPALAYVLCMTAQLNENDVVLDPFCGGGTIPITAGLYFPVNKVLASDVSGKAVDITQANARAAGLSKSRFTAFRSNVSQLRLQPGSVSKIITNLPFGIRTGDHEQNLKVYRAFRRKAAQILSENGLAVILTQEKQLIQQEFAHGFELLEAIEIKQGGLQPTIFIFRRKTKD